MVEESQNIKQKAKKGVYWTTFSNVVNQGTQFAIGIILARLLSPEDYGIIALPAIFLAIAQCFIDSGFSSALVRKEQVTEDDLTTAFYFNICVGIFFYILIFICSPLIADFYNTPILSDVIKVVALGFLFGPLQSVHFALFSRKLDFKTPSIISVSSKMVTGVTGIILAFMGFGIWALVFQGIAGSLLTLAIVWTKSDWRPKGKFSKNSFHYLWGFGSKLLSSSILDTLYNNIVPVVVGKFFSPRDLGILNRGTGYAVMPHNQISSIIGPLTFPVFSRIQNDKEQLDNYFRKLLRLVIFVQAPVNLLLVALAKPLVLFFITDKWIDCVFIVQMVAIAAVIWPIQSLNMSLFNAVGRSDLVLKGNIGVKLLGFCTLVPCLPFGIYFITAMGIFRGFLAVSWMAYFAGKVTKYGLFRQYLEIMPAISLAGVMCGLVFFVTSFINSILAQIVIGGIVGTIFYVGTAYLLKFKEINDVLYLIKVKRKKIMRPLHVVMPMAGEGNRFKKEGWTVPKPLIQLNGKALFLHAISSVCSDDIELKYSFIVRQEHIDEYQIDRIIKSTLPDANIFSVEKTTRGAVETCLIAESVIDDSDAVIVMDCDLEFRSKSFMTILHDILLQSESDANGGALVSFESNDPRYSYAALDENGFVTRTAEKEVISNHALCGAYLFSSGKRFKQIAHKLLDEPEFKKPEYYVSLLYNYLLADGEIVRLAKMEEYYSYGTPEELKKFL